MSSAQGGIAALAVFAVFGCGGQQNAAQPSPGTLVDAALGQSKVGADVLSSYGTIETIAGTGLVEGKRENGWKKSFEGGLATAAELSRPHMALSDDLGRIYIADKDAHAIRRVDENGTIVTVAGTNVAGDGGDLPGVATLRRLNGPNGLWVTGNDTFYVYDAGNNKVRRVRDGIMSTLFEVADASTGRGLWVADDESLAYVSAGSVLKKWTNGQGVETLAGGFVSLGNLVVDANGSLWVADRGGHQVWRIDSLGNKELVAGNGTTTGGGDGAMAIDTGFHEVRGVWPHPDDGFFVATHKGGQTWYVDSLGVAHLFVDGDSDDGHAGDGLLYNHASVRISEPRAITMDHVGNVLITEHDGGFVRRVNLREVR